MMVEDNNGKKETHQPEERKDFELDEGRKDFEIEKEAWGHVPEYRDQEEDGQADKNED